MGWSGWRGVWCRNVKVWFKVWLNCPQVWYAMLPCWKRSKSSKSSPPLATSAAATPFFHPPCICFLLWKSSVCEAYVLVRDQEKLENFSVRSSSFLLLPWSRDSISFWVKMVTGDNVETAKAIALECGILGSFADATEPNIIEGKTFRAMSDAQREEIAEAISVMGRSSPSDKLLLVQALRRKGHVVAVTGDGPNDVPALDEADIGLAMGIQGTEVAKESSDIIILDDNFASVVKVIRWGRSVYANIQKLIQCLLTVKVAALVSVAVTVFSGDVPLNAVQLLWVNLIMDTLGALALATEPPTDHLMDRSPVGRREPLITNIMWRNLLLQAMYQVSVLLVLNFRGTSILGLQHEKTDHAIKVNNTLIFNAFVLCQVFNEFNARKPDEFNIFKGVTRNYLFMGIVGLTVVLQVIIVEFLGKFTTTTRLNWQQWLISVVIGVTSWPLAVVGKFIPVPAAPISAPIANFFYKFLRTSRKKEPEATSRKKEPEASQ